MGMYDEITVRQELPIPEEIRHLNINWKEYTFQTKCLDNCLGEYIIEDNKLVEKIIERQYVEYTEVEKKQRKAQRLFFPIWKDVIETSSYPKPVDDFHGSITFYAIEELNDDEDFWLDFKAYFIYGKLDKIECVKFEKQSSSKTRLDDVTELMHKHQQCPWNTFKRTVNRWGWRFVWRRILAALLFVSNQCESARSFIIQHCL